jgi:Fe(3+) dicitrate transport protein
MVRRFLLGILWAGVSFAAFFSNDVAAQAALAGTVVNAETEAPVAFATVLVLRESESGDRGDGSDRTVLVVAANAGGDFVLNAVGGEDVWEELEIRAVGYSSRTWTRAEAVALESIKGQFELVPEAVELEPAQVVVGVEVGIERMNSVENGRIYRAIKQQIIRADQDIVAQGGALGRQVFAKVAGVNVWESDGAGLQLGIGIRGLSPNRTAHLSVRQNGYPISADPLGYPESYYAPPLKAIERVELVMGAGGLQYGSQLGGMLNFRFKEGQSSATPRITGELMGGGYSGRSAIGERAYGSAFASVDGAVGLAGTTRYYACLDLKSGEGWRPNSAYDARTYHVNLRHARGETLEWGVDWTGMTSLAQQPGGLTDAQFAADPRASFRDRNWFTVDWNLAAVHLTYTPRPDWSVNAIAYGLHAGRKSLGYIGVPGRIDFGDPRDLIQGQFRSGGIEARAVKRFLSTSSEEVPVALFGVQLFRGRTDSQQGMAEDEPGYWSSDADFTYAHPDALEGSDYTFPNRSAAAFHQWIIPIGGKLSVTPGVRAEWIDTRAEGWYRETILNGAGQVIEDSVFTAEMSRSRGILLPGIGASYFLNPDWELYANAVRNYRAMNFSDIQIRDLGLVIDPDIQDESGGNVDIGLRGQQGRWSVDASFFTLIYQDRIGVYQTTVPDPVLIERPVRYRTNIADARNVGLEALVLWKGIEEWGSGWEWFASASVTRGRYLASEESAFAGKRVELIPEYIIRTGLTWSSERFEIGVLYQAVGDQFSDATNAVLTPTAIDGLIPGHQVVDVSGRWRLRNWSFDLKVNNVLDAAYFTRRAAGYPGPGILPSDGRSVQLGIGLEI